MKRNARSLITKAMAVAGLASLIACGAEGPQSSSELKVTNGKVISEGEYPAVLLLEMTNEYGDRGWCTGTFVTDSVVLTAAHCVAMGDMDPDTGRVETTIKYVRMNDPIEKKSETIASSVEVYQNPKWDRARAAVSPDDLGIVIFPPGTAPAVSRIRNNGNPKVGEDFVIVGYGINEISFDTSSSGVKRMGHNKIENIEEGFIKFHGHAENIDGSGVHSASGSGDSGGPLLIGDEIAGVTSGGRVKDGKKYSLYVDLSTPASRAFLSRHLAL